MNQIPYRTNYRLWGIASGCIFLALGFVNPLAGMGMGYNFSLWSLVRPVYWNLDAIGAIVIAFLALLLAVPATLIGWVVQALAVVLWRLLQNATPHSSGTS